MPLVCMKIVHVACLYVWVFIFWQEYVWVEVQIAPQTDWKSELGMTPEFANSGDISRWKLGHEPWLIASTQLAAAGGARLRLPRCTALANCHAIIYSVSFITPQVRRPPHPWQAAEADAAAASQRCCLVVGIPSTFPSRPAGRPAGAHGMARHSFISPRLGWLITQPLYLYHPLWSAASPTDATQRRCSFLPLSSTEAVLVYSS